MSIATQTMTAEEFWDFVRRPENRDRAFELERGEIVEMSLPGRLHGFVCATIAAILFLFARQRKKGYVCSNDTGVIVERDPDSVRGPDILFFEDATTVEQIGKKWAETPALLAVEVLSPNDRIGKVNRRVRDQLAFGTKLVWVVDPDSRNVTVYRPGQGHEVVEESEELTGGDVLPDFRCKVAEFFKLPGQ